METVLSVLGCVCGVTAVLKSFWDSRAAAIQAELALKRAEAAEKRAELESRKSFLAGIICDKDLPLEYRKPFYEEYVSLGGNGTIQKAWLSFLPSPGSV